MDPLDANLDRLRRAIAPSPPSPRFVGDAPSGLPSADDSLPSEQDAGSDGSARGGVPGENLWERLLRRWRTT